MGGGDAWVLREWGKGRVGEGRLCVGRFVSSVQTRQRKRKGAKDAEGHSWRLEGHQGASENELQSPHTVLVIEFNRSRHQMDPDHGTPHAVQIHYPSRRCAERRADHRRDAYARSRGC